MQPITIGNFDATQDDKGNWIYKAKDPKPVKKDERPKYREKAQYSLQNAIEGYSKNRFIKIVNSTVIEVTNFLKNNLK